jgi:hypothetical protein
MRVLSNRSRTDDDGVAIVVAFVPLVTFTLGHASVVLAHTLTLGLALGCAVLTLAFVVMGAIANDHEVFGRHTRNLRDRTQEGSSEADCSDPTMFVCVGHARN